MNFGFVFLRICVVDALMENLAHMSINYEVSGVSISRPARRLTHQFKSVVLFVGILY